MKWLLPLLCAAFLAACAPLYVPHHGRDFDHPDPAVWGGGAPHFYHRHH